MTLTKDILLTSICAASHDVFSTMLSLNAAFGPAFDKQDDFVVSQGVLALIGIAGPWIGTGTISCSPSCACEIASQMLLDEYPEVNGAVLDAMAEMANMIFGNVKTMLEEEVGPLGISIPTVIFGKNFTSKQSASRVWTGVPVYADSVEMELRLGLTPGYEIVGHLLPGHEQRLSNHPIYLGK